MALPKRKKRRKAKHIGHATYVSNIQIARVEEIRKQDEKRRKLVHP
jgi:hypothetical protein